MAGIGSSARGGSAIRDEQGNYYGPQTGYGPNKATRDAGYFRGQAEQAQNRQAESAYGSGALNPALRQEGDARGQQLGALRLQQSAAAGQQPSQAAILASQQSQDALAMQRAQAAGAGPQALAVAQMNAASGAGNAQQQVSAGAMQQRAAEDARARAGYMQSAMGLRQSDMASSAGQQQRLLDQAQLEFDQRRQNDAYSAGMYQNEVNLNLQQQQAATARYIAENQHRTAQEQADLERSRLETDQFKDMVGTTGGFIAGPALSDERTKDVGSTSSGQVSQMLRAFGGAEYTYKPEYADRPEAGRGKHFGPASAQAIASTKLGKNVAKQGDDGLYRIDMTAAVKALMAGAAHLQREIDSLKKGGK